MQALSRTALSCAVVLALSTTIDAHAHTSAPASAAAPAADGNTATGTILGQVLDPATGQYLRNARSRSTAARLPFPVTVASSASPA